MFSCRQILTSSDLLRNFRAIARNLAEEPQALLITRKNRKHLVLASAQIFENLVRSTISADGVESLKTDFRDVLKDE